MTLRKAAHSVHHMSSKKVLGDVIWVVNMAIWEQKSWEQGGCNWEPPARDIIIRPVWRSVMGKV